MGRDLRRSRLTRKYSSLESHIMCLKRYHLGIHPCTNIQQNDALLVAPLDNADSPHCLQSCRSKLRATLRGVEYSELWGF